MKRQQRLGDTVFRCITWPHGLGHSPSNQFAVLQADNCQFQDTLSLVMVNLNHRSHVGFSHGWRTHPHSQITRLSQCVIHSTWLRVDNHRVMDHHQVPSLCVTANRDGRRLVPVS
jgi:hypothetical protein